MITVSQVKDRIETDLDDLTLQLIVDAEQEALDRHAGGESVTETHMASGNKKLILRRRPASIASITERQHILDDAVTLSANDYRQIGQRFVLRLGDGDNPAVSWGAETVVTYTAEVDQNLRDRIVLDLVQLSIEFSAYASEKSGDWTGDQGDYEARRNALLSQLSEPRLLMV